MVHDEAGREPAPDRPAPDRAERAWTLRYVDPAAAREAVDTLPPGPARDVVAGALARREQRVEEALHLFVRALSDPDVPPVWRSRAQGGAGTVLSDLGLFDEAVEVYRRRLADPDVARDPHVVAGIQHDLGYALQYTDPDRALHHYVQVSEMMQAVLSGVVVDPEGHGLEVAALAALAAWHAHELAAGTGVPVPPGVPSLADAEGLARRGWPELADGIRAARVRALLEAGAVERAVRLGRSLPDPLDLRDVMIVVEVTKAHVALLTAQGHPDDAARLLDQVVERVPPEDGEEMLGLLTDVHRRTGDLAAALDAADRRVEVLRDVTSHRAVQRARALAAWYRSVHTPHAEREVERIVDELRRRLERHDHDRARLEERLGTDDLTGLHNRRHLLATVEALPPCRHAVAVLDLDDFKTVNDTEGHLAGDDVLRRVAVALRRATAPEDVCCRYGGDEFVVVRPGDDGTALAADLAGLVRVDTGRRVLGLSIGVAGFTGADVDAGVEAADRAMYDVKRAGGHGIARVA